MNIQTPDDLLIDQLRDLYSVECQLILTLPGLAAAATDPPLRRILLRMEESSRSHKARIREVCELLETTPEGAICHAIKGLIEGGNKHLAMTSSKLATDLLLIAHANRMIHYALAGYGFATALARRLGNRTVEMLIERTLDEEKMASTRLCEVACSKLSAISTPEERTMVAVH